MGFDTVLVQNGRTIDLFPPEIHRRAGEVPIRVPRNVVNPRSEIEGEPMTNEQNKVNARRIVDESWNKHNTLILNRRFS